MESDTDNVPQPWRPSPEETRRGLIEQTLYMSIQLHQGLGSPAHHIIATAKEFFAYLESELNG